MQEGIINKEMLFEDIKWPLKWDSDCRLYIFDAENNMIAEVDSDLENINTHPFEKLLGDYKEPEINYVQFSLHEGVFYDIFNPEEPVGCVRGFGRLQYKDKPEERQDNIANYILSIINT